ncbi:MAG: hypothetical protein KF779_09015 [Hyphomonadaceae bacterium]|nr:hypothetical protein [Hyphomonadaceae bacterium]
MVNRNLALAGAVLLIVGLFVPIVSVPVFGNINLITNANAAGLALLALAVLTAALAAKPNTLEQVLWPGLAAVAVISYSFVTLLLRLAAMRQSVRDLDGNPFAGFVQGAMASIQVQWGWLPLAGGASLVLYAALCTWSDELTVADVVRRPFAKLAVAGSAFIAMAVPLAQLASGASQ